MLRENDFNPLGRRSAHAPLAVDFELLCLDLVRHVRQIHPRTFVGPCTFTQTSTTTTFITNNGTANVMSNYSILMTRVYGATINECALGQTLNEIL